MPAISHAGGETRNPLAQSPRRPRGGLFGLKTPRGAGRGETPRVLGLGELLRTPRDGRGLAADPQESVPLSPRGPLASPGEELFDGFTSRGP